MKYVSVPVSLLCLFAIVAEGCRHKVQPLPGIEVNPAATQYPLEVANIMIKKCATAGCHNETSYTSAGGLRLDDWQYLFNGSVNGAVVVPFNAKYSPFLYFVNTDSARGLVAQPKMPYNPAMPNDNDGLPVEEYELLKKWIEEGAPDKHGNIAFASNPATRQKIYLTQQNCDDLIAVIDAEKKVVMRYIYGGVHDFVIEKPHNVKVDHAGRYAYVCMNENGVVQKIDTYTDSIVGTVTLSGSLEVLTISPDDKQLAVSSLLSGNIKLVDAEKMQLIKTYGELNKPHGIATNPGFDTFYITAQTGNYIYMMPVGGKEMKISIDGFPADIAHKLDPHEIIMAPDYSKYFLTCEMSDEIRVVERTTNKLLKVIPVGKKPQEMALSKELPYLFVTCIDDPVGSTLYKGSVYVINYQTFEVVKKISGKLAAPHGITVDDHNGLFYVASTNDATVGSTPHHPSNCGGKNGNYKIYSIHTLMPYNSRTYEVSTFPYSLDTRFKK